MNRMRLRPCGLTAALCVLAAPAAVYAQTPLGSAFSYQGQLKLLGSPLNDTADFEFTLWDADTGGNMIGAVWPVNNVTVVDGLFTVELDFGVAVFNGDARWLEIAVRSPAGGGAFTTLSPRQPLTGVPYALQTRGMYCDTAGNVGVGTTAPQHLLSVGDGTADAKVVGIRSYGDTGPDWKGGAAFGYDSASVALGELNGVATIAAHNADLSTWATLAINPGGTTTFGGDVGIGIAIPAYRLHVVGNGIQLPTISGHNDNLFGIGTEGVAVGYASTGVSGRGTAYGVHGTASVDTGVYGDGHTTGVAGYSLEGTGLHGSGAIHGVYGTSSGDTGVVGTGPVAGGYFQDSDHGGWCQAGVGIWKTLGSGAVSFVQNHPEQADRVIVYACPEGDEAATYTRGTARLVDGEARVALGETFKWVTNPDVGLTAHLTPRAQAVPLAVVSLTTQELVVRGPDEGPNEIVFDYLVYGLRIGFEEMSVVQEKTLEAPIPSMAQFPQRYEQYPELRRFNALERFKAMRRASGETQPLDLSAAHALRDAIGEFDPAVDKVESLGAPDFERMRPEHDNPPADDAKADVAAEARPASRHALNEIVRSKDGEIAELRAECAAGRQRTEALEERLSRMEKLLANVSAQN